MIGWRERRSAAKTAHVERRTYKAFRAGTDRLFSPEETVARVRPYMAAVGITRVANITGLDAIGVPVVMVCSPRSSPTSVLQCG